VTTGMTCSFGINKSRACWSEDRHSEVVGDPPAESVRSCRNLASAFVKAVVVVLGADIPVAPTLTFEMIPLCRSSIFAGFVGSSPNHLQR
jgi:hypothetical protein